MRSRRSVIAGVATLALVAAACGTGSPSGQSSPTVKQGGVLRIGTSSGIDSMNVFVAFSQDSYSTWMNIYPALVQYDTRTYKYAPYFAKSWSESSDGLTWTFHTVPGAHWSDGQPLDANDVA